MPFCRFAMPQSNLSDLCCRQTIMRPIFWPYTDAQQGRTSRTWSSRSLQAELSSPNKTLTRFLASSSFAIIMGFFCDRTYVMFLVHIFRHLLSCTHCTFITARHREDSSAHLTPLYYDEPFTPIVSMMFSFPAVCAIVY